MLGTLVFSALTAAATPFVGPATVAMAGELPNISVSLPLPQPVAAIPSAPVAIDPQAAIHKAGTSEVLDDGLTYGNSRPFRSFGHGEVDGHHFDSDGNWLDSQTAVTADQFAAMPADEQALLARVTHVPLASIRTGDAARVVVEPALGEAGKDPVDLFRGVQGNPRHFGHHAVRGRFFVGRSWADTKTLVSADQAAAMPPVEREQFARENGAAVEALRPGQASRAVQQEIGFHSRFDGVAARSPRKMVEDHGFPMRATTAAHYEKLLSLIGKRFPGRTVAITATTNGEHSDPKHADGLAIDFVVEPLSRKESKVLESLAWKAGFHPFNEYVHNSRFKTGPHMHVDVP